VFGETPVTQGAITGFQVDEDIEKNQTEYEWGRSEQNEKTAKNS